jgi:hypothetical protein
VHQPTRIRIGDETVAGLEQRAHGANAFDVGIRVTADFELESGVALGTVLCDALRHRLWRFLRNGPIQPEVSAVPASQENAHRLAGDLAKDVRARHVDS